MAIIAIYLAKLLDPITAVLAIIGGLISRAGWHVLVVGLVVAAMIEGLLYTLQPSRVFNANGLFFLIGIASAATWAGLAYYIRNRISAAKAAKQD